jgi:amino-acid N-acetyltransferase
MSDPRITLQDSTTETLDYVESVLDANDLPTADLHRKPESFVIAVDGSERVGIGGVERHGTDGLLRSVVVTEPHRGQGYGTVLCDELERRARASGVKRLYLLTTTAAPFFRGRGYEEIDREAAPARIRETTEFSELCPETATCLQKTLEDGE